MALLQTTQSSPLGITDARGGALSQWVSRHAAILLLGLVLVLEAVGAPARIRGGSRRLLAVGVAQGAVGFLQYATHLPAWLWGRNKDGEWKTIDPNSASDAVTGLL